MTKGEKKKELSIIEMYASTFGSHLKKQNWTVYTMNEQNFFCDFAHLYLMV